MNDQKKVHRSRGRPRAKEANVSSSRIQSVDRALRVFKLLSEDIRAPLNVIAATADLPFSTTHRILETLREHGMVTFDEVDQTWSIGVEAFRIGQGYARRMNFLDVGREIMRELTEQTGETSSIAVFDNWSLVHVSQIETDAPIRVFIPPGSRSQLHASGIGKALLANMKPDLVDSHLRQAELLAYTEKTLLDVDAIMSELALSRRRGWAIDDEERYIGMRCIAAPVFNEFGEAVAGISISGPTRRFSDDRIENLARQVRVAADTVTHESGGRPPGNK